MPQLNHINLGVSNVPELTRFFQEGFGFRIEETRGMGKFAVLLGEDGFVLILMHDKNVTADTYPALFHVGFLVGSYQAVRDRHQQIVEAGFEAPAPAILERGGNKTFGFYAKPCGWWSRSAARQHSGSTMARKWGYAVVLSAPAHTSNSNQATESACRRVLAFLQRCAVSDISQRRGIAKTCGKRKRGTQCGRMNLLPA